MPLFLFSTLLVVAAEPQPGADSHAPDDGVFVSSPSELDAGVQLRDEARVALRAARASATKPPTEEAARWLLDVYGRLVDDEHLRSVERQRLLGTVRSRLARVADALQKDLDRRADGKGRRASQREPAPDNVELPPQQQDILAQQQVAPRGGAAQQPPGARRPPGGAAVDYGQDLVDLIQQTIAVPTWDINGGPGTIYYYRPLRVLVIRQTSEVHGRVGGVLNQVRGN